MNFESELRIIEGVAAQAFEVWGCPELIDCTTFEFNNRFTSRLGDAKFVQNGTNRIRLSSPIWPHINDDEREDTIVHEAAHVASPFLKLKQLHSRGVRGQVDRFGRERFIPTPRIGHGAEWKRLMRQAGFKPERCHKVDTAALGLKRKRYRYAYPCGCPTPCLVGPKHHKSIRGYSRVTCRRCRVRLQWTSNIRKVEI